MFKNYMYIYAILYILCIYLKLNKYTYTCHYQDKDEAIKLLFQLIHVM